jgi:hypothetical protein
MALTIDDLLNALQNPKTATLENSREIWERIGRGDSFPELGLDSSELESFLTDWIRENPYSNL